MQTFLKLKVKIYQIVYVVLRIIKLKENKSFMLNYFTQKRACYNS